MANVEWWLPLPRRPFLAQAIRESRSSCTVLHWDCSASHHRFPEIASILQCCSILIIKMKFTSFVALCQCTLEHEPCAWMGFSFVSSASCWTLAHSKYSQNVEWKYDIAMCYHQSVCWPWHMNWQTSPVLSVLLFSSLFVTIHLITYTKNLNL